MIPNFLFFQPVGKPFAVTTCMILAIKGLQSGLKWMDAFYRQKGVEHALDYIGDSLNFVASGIGEWLHDGWGHSYSAGHCHHRVGGSPYSGTKNNVAICTLAGEGEIVGKEVVSRSRKILPNFRILSAEKFS